MIAIRDTLSGLMMVRTRAVGQHVGVTDGLAVLAGWVMFGLLLLALATVILRRGGGSG
jgi:hypothetical protein